MLALSGPSPHRRCLALFTSFWVMSKGLDELGIADFPVTGKGGNS